MKLIDLAPVLTAAAIACSPPSPNNLDSSWPDVAQYYRLENGVPVCDGAATAELSQDGQQYTCTWQRVVVDGEPRCLAIVVFSQDEQGHWMMPPTVFVTHATICT